MLSALGAWMDVSGSWDSVPFKWRHIVAMGRDQYVRVVNQGFLYPFGHRVDQIIVTERKLEQAPDRTLGDILTKRTVLVVTDPVRDFTSAEIRTAYPKGGRELPFQRARLTTLATPMLEGGGTSYMPMVGGVPFQFHLVLDDCDGHPIDCSMPLVFGQHDLLDTDFRSLYDVTAPIALQNQLVALAPSGTGPGTARLNTVDMWFDVLQVDALTPSLLPTMKQASVIVPAISSFLGSSSAAATSGATGATTITFHTGYLANGLDSNLNAGEVFAQIQSPIKLPLSADRIGGVGALTMPLDGLSYSRGPVPNADNLAVPRAALQPSTNTAQNSTSTAQNLLRQIVSALDFTLLGVSLTDIIEYQLPAGSDPLAQIPSLLTTRSQSAIETTFDWQPTLTPTPPPPASSGSASADSSGSTPAGSSPTGLNIKDDTQLRLHADIVAPLDGSQPTVQPTFTIDGSLCNGMLNLFGVVEVTFDQISFHVERGKKPDLSTSNIAIQFIGCLAFLTALADVLPPSGFSDPPAINATPDGITAGYTLGIPNAGVGVFSLENINLTALLSLPFEGLCGLELDFSDSHHPFLVTVSMIGGGGSFGLGVDAHGINRLEATLELGGNLSIDLAIVSANAHVMAGFYFSWQASALVFSAYLRIGASVDLLGLISVSIDLYLALQYDPGSSSICGIGSLTVSVHVLFATPSFTLQAMKCFDVPKPAHDPTFDQVVDAQQWQTYCRAFA
jgi:hypothetical protein